MTTIEIKISAKKSEVTTKGYNSIFVSKVHNDNIAYCIDKYISVGQLVSLCLTKQGDADVYFQALMGMKKVFNTEECIFGDKLMILIKEPNLKVY